MANSSLTLTSLDFDTLKQNFKTFLSTQSVFKDYNFDGSNISVLLDVMAYNSYLNSFYLNMVASEMFLDSAQKWESVVSHAKELNYTPRSAKSSVANVTINVTTIGTTPPFVIPKGTGFTGINSNGSFVFVTNQSHTYTSPNNQYTASELQLFEGKYVNNSFIMDYSDETQKFVLTNKNIDIDSLTITVYENNSQNTTSFSKVDTLFNLNGSSNVFFVQAAQNNQYEILFGDGYLGRRPQNQALIVADYRITSGSSADGITSFVINKDLGPVNGGKVAINSITVTSNSAGGANNEQIESIRFQAPRYFATQQRAVATDDYSSLILSKFGGQISDAIVYGGETVEPKQYGRVILSLKYASGTIVPDYVKDEIHNYMLKYVSLPTRIIVKDPDYLYCKIDSSIQYNKNSTTKLPNDIKSIVLAAIQQFSTEHLEKFGKDFRYSKFVAHIDNSDDSITSNNTELKIIKKITPLLNYETSYEIEFNNAAEYEGVYPGKSLSDEPVLTSTYFTYVTSDGTQYTNSYIQDNSQGVLIVYTYINGIYTVLNNNLGTIDYDTGIVKINKFKVSNYNNVISLYMSPRDKDIIVNQSKILLIDLNDVNLEVIETVG